MEAWVREEQACPGQNLCYMPSCDEYRACAKTFPEKKAYGSDGIHPRQKAVMSDDLLWALVQLYGQMLSLSHCPALVKRILMRLIPKPEGAGFRAVGIFTSFIRVMHRALRRSFGQWWMAKNLPRQWYGVTGKSVQQAVWARSVAARYAKSQGLQVSVTFWDVQKAFE